MKLVSLASSSAGNCYLMKLDMGEGREASLMVECGLQYGTIMRRLAENGNQIKISELSGCLITHCHQDHCRGALELAKRGIHFFATADTLKSVGVLGTPLDYGKVTAMENGLYVIAFRVEHDAPGSAGFVIMTKYETVIFAIDSSRWIDDLGAFKPDYVFIESNFDDLIMSAEISSLRMSMNKANKDKAYNDLKLDERVCQSHMSIAQTLRTLRTLDLSKCKAIFLMHLSDRLSAPSAFKNAVRTVTGVQTLVLRKDGGTE